AAVAGVAFANLLVLMQLGFFGALIGSVRFPYDQFNAGLLISASDMNTLTDGSPLPRQRMFEALAVPGVAGATPLYFAKLDWKQPDGTIRTLDVFGVDPAARAFRNPEINMRLAGLSMSDIALIDRKTRNAPKGLFASIDAGAPYTFETKGRTLKVIGTFGVGGGFSADGELVVSDQTFFKLFPNRMAGAPNLVLVRLEPGAQPTRVLAGLRAILPDYDSAVRTVEEAVWRDQKFQTTQRPVGIVFGFGVIIGVLVGLIIVYQVLSTDVADHMREYATFKAIGYPQRFFMSIIFEEAFILAILGFIPGFLISLLLYFVVSKAISLPLAMTLPRALGVLGGTIIMCSISGAIATRKLARANPADLF
ncbi:MAG TPA: ABC transporter permease DevC, partial [Rhabdaerophilum sp.]|nr:ABC transporter permease DevC [Rhabdaerophilum sp.]